MSRYRLHHNFLQCGPVFMIATAKGQLGWLPAIHPRYSSQPAAGLLSTGALDSRYVCGQAGHISRSLAEHSSWKFLFL